MKLLHIADLHLGKHLHEVSLLPIQENLLKQVIDTVIKYEIDGLLLAGDIYDRSVPPSDAVEVLNTFLVKVVNELHKKVFLISGNHDSSERLNFVSKLLQTNGLYMETYIHEKLVYQEFDQTRIYFLPFFTPIDIQSIYEEAPRDTYSNALSYYLSKQEPLDKNYTNILITHGFVGNKVIESDSEVLLSIGGIEKIDETLFKDFDYVALGHLHAFQKITDNIYYSGSLYKYSFSESKQKKQMILYDTNTKEKTFIPFQNEIDVKVVQALFQDLLNNTLQLETHHFYAFELLDHSIIPYGIERLKTVYPNTLRLTYPNLYHESESHHVLEMRNNMHPYELFESFYKEMTNQPLDEEKQKIVKELMEEEA